MTTQTSKRLEIKRIPEQDEFSRGLYKGVSIGSLVTGILMLSLGFGLGLNTGTPREIKQVEINGQRGYEITRHFFKNFRSYYFYDREGKLSENVPKHLVQLNNNSWSLTYLKGGQEQNE